MRGVLTFFLSAVAAMPAHAEKLDDLWAIAEVRIIVERCKYARVDERAVAAVREKARIDLKENAEDRWWYAYYKDDRRNMLWVKGDGAVCQRGYMLYGPGTWPQQRLLIFDPSWK